MKILLVDDHALFREGMRLILHELDPSTDVTQAENCASAFEKLRQNVDIDVVLLDLSLPDVQGMEALRRLRTERCGIPVVVLSARDDRATIIEALDAGAMGFIPKSSTSRILISALHLVLSSGVYIPPAALDLAPKIERVQTNAAPRVETVLTERQMQVLELLVQGKPTKLISRELGVAEGTAKVHITSVFRALNVTNRTQAVVAVNQLGLTFCRGHRET